MRHGKGFPFQDKIWGICGGGGYAISAKVLQTLFDNFESRTQFFDTYMMFNSLTEFGDITTSHFLKTFANPSFVKLDGLNPWKVDRLDQFISKGGKSYGIPILTLHYASGRMQEYIDIIQKHEKLNALPQSSTSRRRK